MNTPSTHCLRWISKHQTIFESLSQATNFTTNITNISFVSNTDNLNAVIMKVHHKADLCTSQHIIFHMIHTSTHWNDLLCLATSSTKPLIRLAKTNITLIKLATKSNCGPLRVIKWPQIHHNTYYKAYSILIHVI